MWIVSDASVVNPSGGNALLYSTDGGKTFAEPGNKILGVNKVAGAPDGSCWYIDGDLVVWSANTNGEVTAIAPANSAMDIALDADGRVWIISTEINTTLGGNIVQATTLTEKSFKNIKGDPVAAAISAWQDGSAWIVTPKGEAGFIELNGDTGLLSTAGENIATDISVSPNGGTAWIVGLDPDTPSGGNRAQYWDSVGDKSSDWKVIPNIEGIYISGGG